MKIIMLIATTALIFGATSTIADNDDLKMLEKTKVTIVEAIKTAEQHKGGKAFEAEIDEDESNPEYEVKVSVGQKVFEVTVDGISGKVTHTKEN